jgi:tetratricopeptide (TPR) repeat protein
VETLVNDVITLSAYTEEIRNLIYDDRNDEALALCRHILRYYPKHVDTYRQMAKASLEKGDLDSARDLFRRVLGADPEDVVAYAGLAIIFEQQHLNDEALWHLERAYELAPANPEIRKELLRLYAETEAKPRDRLKLTPCALAHLFVQEGLFSQAIQEFGAIASSAPSRFDARVALVEVLWHAGRVRDAANVAHSLLEPLPYCLKANLILGTVWHESGLKESETYLRRAQALDPMNQTAQQMLGARSPLRPTQVLVPRYVEGAQPAAVPELAADLVLEHFPETEWFTPALLASEKPAIETPPSAPAEEIAPVTQTPAIEMPLHAPIEAAPFAEAEAAKVETPPPSLVAEAKATPQVSGAPRVAQPATKPIVKPTVAIPSSLPSWLTEFQRISSDTDGLRKTETAEEKIETPTSMPPPLVEEPKTEKGELPPETSLVPATEEGPVWLRTAPSRQAAGLATTSESELTSGEISAPSWATLAPTAEPHPEPSDETHEASELPDWLRETPTPPAATVVSPEKSVATETYIEPELESAQAPRP